jgi:hypothetical protein
MSWEQPGKTIEIVFKSGVKSTRRLHDNQNPKVDELRD